MAWHDNLRAASFRGVPFKVESHDMSGGRRTVTHEFALRDKPYVEDMGKKAKEFSLDAYVLGDDYMSARDALLGACDQEGPAELVHPYLGTKKVACTGYTLRESRGEGRLARITLNFVEAGDSAFPTAIFDSIAQAILAADFAQELSIFEFAEQFSIDGMPEFAIADATGMLTSAADGVSGMAGFALADATGMLTSAADGVRGMADRVSSLTNMQSGVFGQVKGFVGGVSALMRAPHALAAAFHGMVSDVTSLFDEPREAMRALSSLFNFGKTEKAIKKTTATRARQEQNRAAIIGLVRQAVAIQSVRIAPTATFQTNEDAFVSRDAVANQIDEILDDPATSDATFSALQRVRTVIVTALPPAAVALPNLMTITPPVTLPALVLAFDVYGDAKRDADIVSRNRIVHPGFVTGMQPLKVVADA